jgi:hypothetical protein
MKHYPVWTARITPWLRLGPAPGSFRIKSPPRMMRRGPGPLTWAPYVTIVQALHDPSVRLGVNLHRI